LPERSRTARRGIPDPPLRRGVEAGLVRGGGRGLHRIGDLRGGRGGRGRARMLGVALCACRRLLPRRGADRDEGLHRLAAHLRRRGPGPPLIPGRAGLSPEDHRSRSRRPRHDQQQHPQTVVPRADVRSPLQILCCRWRGTKTWSASGHKLLLRIAILCKSEWLRLLEVSRVWRILGSEDPSTSTKSATQPVQLR